MTEMLFALRLVGQLLGLGIRKRIWTLSTRNETKSGSRSQLCTYIHMSWRVDDEIYQTKPTKIFWSRNFGGSMHSCKLFVCDSKLYLWSEAITGVARWERWIRLRATQRGLIGGDTAGKYLRGRLFAVPNPDFTFTPDACTREQTQTRLSPSADIAKRSYINCGGWNAMPNGRCEFSLGKKLPTLRKATYVKCAGGVHHNGLTF